MTETHGSAVNPLLNRQQVLEQFALRLSRAWQKLPAPDRHFDRAEQMTGIPIFELTDYLLGLKEPDLAHLILLADYVGCRAIDLWPSRKELTDG